MAHGALWTKNMLNNTVSTTELRRVLDIILRSLEEHGISEIELKDDYYWDVPQDERYGVRDRPTQLSVGQLADDVNELKRILRGDEPPQGLGLIWLGSVLRRIGELSSV